MAEMQDIKVRVSAEVIHEIEVDIMAMDGFADGYSSIPAQARKYDAGYDLKSTMDGVIYAGEQMMFDTGIALAIPKGYAGFIKPRSGLAAKHGIDVLGGVIDSGYRGEVRVILLNTSRRQFEVKVGDRIAQLVIQPVASATFIPVAELDESERADGGFGSTGVSL